MTSADNAPLGYLKLHNEVYYKKVDLLPLLQRQDRYQTGLISQRDFFTVFKVSGLQLTDKEVYDIVRLAPTDSKGEIYYRTFLRNLERTQPAALPTETQPTQSEDSSTRLKQHGDFARQVLSFFKQSAYVGFNRFLVNGVFTETSFLEFFSQSAERKEREVRDLWKVMPTLLSPQMLIKWAQGFTSQHVLKTLPTVPVTAVTVQLPAIVSRLRSLAQTCGLPYIQTALCSFPFIRLPDLRDILTQLECCESIKDFEEFRLWSVTEGVIHLLNSELAFEGQRLLPVLDGFSGDGNLVSGSKSQLGNVADLAVKDMLNAQMMTLKRLLMSESGSDSVSEKHIRKVFQSALPSLTHQNVSLALNSLQLVTPPVQGFPFRKFSVAEILQVFSMTENARLGSIPPFPGSTQIEKKEEIQKSNPEPISDGISSPGNVGKPALLGSRGTEWESVLFSKLKSSLLAFSSSLSIAPLLSIFRKVDSTNAKVLSLERFHWTLKQGLPFLSDPEIYHLVMIGVEVAGAVDERRTQEVRNRLRDYLDTSETIGRALFPDGTQYMISYTFFALHLEARIRMLSE